MPFSASPDYYILGRNFFPLHKRVFLCKSAGGRVSVVNLQYECVWMSAAREVPPSVVYKVMEAGSLAADS